MGADEAEQRIVLATQMAKHPSGSHTRTAFWVFSLLTLAFFGIAFFCVFLWYAAATGAISAHELGGDPSTFRNFGAGSLGAGILMALLAIHKHRASGRARRSRELLRDAVARGGGQWIDDGRMVAYWLARHFRGAFPWRGLATTPDIARAALVIDGYPVLVEVTPAGVHVTSSSGGTNVWWSRAWVGAELPNPEGALAATHAQRIEALGYRPAVEPGGLVARGTSKTERAIRASPERVLDLLEVASELVQIAKSAGGRPVSHER